MERGEVERSEVGPYATKWKKLQTLQATMHDVAGLGLGWCQNSPPGFARISLHPAEVVAEETLAAAVTATLSVVAAAADIEGRAPPMRHRFARRDNYTLVWSWA